jgi:hypothetical protein
VTLPRRPSWYHHLAPVTGLVPCEGEQHRVTWQRGKVVLENHDLGSERALLVLGGQPSACLRALRLWRDQFGLPPEQFATMQTWLGAQAVLAPEELALPRLLGMTLSWDRAWRRSSHLEKHGRLIEAQLRERALTSFRHHLTAEKQRFRCRVISSADVRVVPAGEPLAVEGRMNRVSVSARAMVHTSWLVRVWPRQMAVVDGAFVVDVEDDSFTEPRVQAVRWEDQSDGTRAPVLALARVRRADDGAWHLTWVPAP